MKPRHPRKGGPRPRAWSDEDRFAFATARLRAKTVPAKRRPGPSAADWA